MCAHHWITAARRRDRDRLRSELDLPPVLAVLDAHRRLRGPYTAAGSLLRTVGPDLLRRHPDFGQTHEIEILTVAPELLGPGPGIWRGLEWRVGEQERTRFFSRLHTLNVAHGLAELVRAMVADAQGEPRTLVIENVDQADATDQEFVAVLLRRTDLGPLSVVVGTGPDGVTDPRGEIAISLVATLADRTVRHDSPVHDDDAPPDPDPSTVEQLARSFVDSDGTVDDPVARAAYDGLDAGLRAAMHDDRARALREVGEFSLLLGAVTYHEEHGSDPLRGGMSLKYALDHCRRIGLYQAAVELGGRGRELIGRDRDPDLWWHFTDGMGTAMASMGRADEALAVYDEVRAVTVDPMIHMDLAYGTSMLYARHFPEPQRDYQRARAWINQAIAIGGLLEDPKMRAFHSVFGRNGLALVEVREKKPEEALKLLDYGMARLDRELDADEHVLHRAVLRYNRAQVYVTMGRLDEALADYTDVIALDPYFREHHFNIATILRRMGRTEEAITAFEQSLRLSPPFPEAYYNIGDARLELGDVDGALAAFAYTLELDPDHVEARVNRAGLLCDLGESEAAWQDVSAGLAVAPDNAHLRCVEARLLAERGDLAAAVDAADAALAQSPLFAEAWAIRAGLLYETGALEEAIVGFDRALELGAAPEIRYNRGVVYQEAGRLTDAIKDFEAVLSVLDDEHSRRRLHDCRVESATVAVR